MEQSLQIEIFVPGEVFRYPEPLPFIEEGFVGVLTESMSVEDF